MAPSLSQFLPKVKVNKSFPGGSVGKESAYNSGGPSFNPWFGKIPWRREWQPNPVFLPEKSHGQKSPMGYRPWGCRQLDKTEQLNTDEQGNSGFPVKEENFIFI